VYCDAVNAFPKKSKDCDVNVTDPVNSVFSISTVITVGGTGLEPESN